MSALCTCLHLHSALPPTCNVSSSVLSFVHLCSPIRHNPSKETLSTLVSKGGKRRSGERWRKQGLVATLQLLSSNVPAASNTALGLPAKPGSPVWFRIEGAASCCSCTPGRPDYLSSFLQCDHRTTQPTMSHVGPVSFSAPESSLAVICGIYSLSYHSFCFCCYSTRNRVINQTGCLCWRESFLLELNSQAGAPWVDTK